MQALRGHSYRHHARPRAQVDVQRLGLYDPAADQHIRRVLGEPVCASWSSRKAGRPLLPCNMMARVVSTESWLPAPNPADLRGEKHCSQEGAGQGNGAGRQTLAVTSGRPKARSGASRCVPRHPAGPQGRGWRRHCSSTGRRGRGKTRIYIKNNTNMLKIERYTLKIIIVG